MQVRDVWMSSKGLYSLRHAHSVCPCDGCLVHFFPWDSDCVFLWDDTVNGPQGWLIPVTTGPSQLCLPSPIPLPNPCSVYTHPLWQGGVRKMNLSCVSAGSSHIPVTPTLQPPCLASMQSELWQLLVSCSQL